MSEITDFLQYQQQKLFEITGIDKKLLSNENSYNEECVRYLQYIDGIKLKLQNNTVLLIPIVTYNKQTLWKQIKQLWKKLKTYIKI